jgi:hypothetical protein
MEANTDVSQSSAVKSIREKMTVEIKVRDIVTIIVAKTVRQVNAHQNGSRFFKLIVLKLNIPPYNF